MIPMKLNLTDAKNSNKFRENPIGVCIGSFFFTARKRSL